MVQKRNLKIYALITLFMLIFLNSCKMPARSTASLPPISTRYAEWQQTLTPNSVGIDSPSVTQTPLPNEEVKATPENISSTGAKLIFLHPGLPQSIRSALGIPENNMTENQQDAIVSVRLDKPGSAANNPVSWVYTVVAPFYTTTDGLSLEGLSALWRGQISNGMNITSILVTSETHAAMSVILGQPDETFVNIVTKESLDELALSDQPFLSLLPFDELTPHWKVLRVEGQSPIDDTFVPSAYPLTAQIWVEGEINEQTFTIPATNYDPEKRTVLIMTGVTALVRATAHRMEIQGNTYPGRDVINWLSAADLVHISNEVAFAENCPDPDPFQTDLIFCSSPDRIELLEHISADIIELSGNHMLDYGVQAMNLTLEMYTERGWTTYAGGWDLADARKPAQITHNGNQLAFIGCNPVGPPNAWATSTQPGSAPCGDYQWLLDEIVYLRSQDYLPIVTLQYAEDYSAYPSAQMVADFKRLADAGALIVNGSQAHTPKSMVFHNGSFLHYGLGNLFFDQMEVYYSGSLMQGTREGFIDRLIFYNGQLVSIELLTTMLEDYARPRPMITSEREALLNRIFPLALESYQ